ncbi:MBOAT family O-acyltransferase [Candidatus Marithrix sp. Canyon 246]|uniref:MBOAT family O-acyltransferase n=1 Tax=Candidatus Marithrix sp. Canyon 246 TaxID=1827136 RepID=UPI00084A2A70|nr:MBOAT family protein [Candidatus Marithrix sp. Canyon 246]
MLFNSYEFIFLFLPITLLVFFSIGGRGHHRIAIAWLVGASLFFYGWWNPAYLGLILASILFNYATGVALLSQPSTSLRFASLRFASRGIILLFGICVNLFLLGYFKYANFFVDNLNSLSGSTFHLETIILPLAISFFTFQQITYLVDAYKGETREYNFLHYCLFVTFFPQLIAGPIVHHREMLPQFAKSTIYKLNYDHLAVGLTIFFLGLFKKVFLADGVAVYATPVFDAAEQGLTLSFFEAWAGALAYSLQLYFDFSGYSDMAIGIARMFGVRLPLNFNSPYKAINIIDFWRCWHMTLSRFLRDYVYIPLGGNRKGKWRRYVNLMITMLLGGLWHGAGWTFVAWGALHGFYLMINHGWRTLRRALGHDLSCSSWWGRGLSLLITFMAVVVAWVFFRAESFGGAMMVLEGMSGVNGFSLPLAWLQKAGSLAVLENLGIGFEIMVTGFNKFWVINIFFTLLIVWFMPNTQQFMYGKIRWQWQASPAWAVSMALVATVAVLSLTRVSEFLYFQF